MLLKEAAAHFLFSGHNFQEKRQWMLLYLRNIHSGAEKNEILFVIPSSYLF